MSALRSITSQGLTKVQHPYWQQHSQSLSFPSNLVLSPKMFTKRLTMMALLVLSAIATVSSGAKLTKSFFLSLTPEALFAYGLKDAVGGCKIGLNTGSSAYADLYVTSATVGARGYRGWPRNRRNLGTGAVKAPDFPRRRSFCWYQRSEYNLPRSLRTAFCTRSGLHNAAAQLKDAIMKNQCNL